MIFMKKKKITESILSSIQILFFIALCIFVCSQSFIHTFWINEISPYLTFEYNKGFDVAFVVFLLIIILLCIKNKNIYISNKQYFITICINSVYLYLRINTKDEFKIFFYPISYFDCLFIGSIIVFLFKFIYDKFKSNNENTPKCLLKSDAPIKTFEEDKMQRDGLVYSLTEEILTLNSIDHAHSIALISPWGSGKTSFINLLKISLKKENRKDIEIIDFCPWHLSSKKDYTEVFFKKISDILKFQDNSLYKVIKDYIPLVTNTNKDLFSKFEDHFIDSYSSFDFVADKLRESGKTFIIIIDDVDRLDANEIKNVLKIIRGSANFPNFTFIVAFDKQYVENTLKENATAIDENYLKKFFNIEYHLPTCKQSTLKEILTNFAKSLEDSEKEQFIEYINVDDNAIKLGCFNPFDYIKDIRDTNRWTNAITLDFKKLKNEVRITDLANLELLKICFPQAYYLIKKEKNTFFEVRGERYILYRKNDNKSNDYYFTINNKTEIFTTDEIKSLGNLEIKRLEKLLDQLFPNPYNYIKPKSICDLAYFDRYFQTILGSEDVSDFEFKNMIKSNYQEATDYLAQNIKVKNLSLNRMFQNYNPQNQEEVKNIIRAIFTVCKNSPTHIINPDHVHRLINTLEEPEKHEFVKKILLENGYSKYVNQTLQRQNGGISDWTDFMTIEERRDIHVKMLEFAINENRSMFDIYDSYHKTIIFFNNGEPQFNLNSQNLIWDVAKKRPKDFFTFIIIKDHMRSDKECYWNLMGTCEFMWKDDQDFESKIQQLSDCEIIDEFLDFYKKYKKNGYQSTEYKFVKINEDEIMMKY